MKDCNMYRHSLRKLRLFCYSSLLTLLYAASAASQPLYLYGSDGDSDELIRLDVNTATPTLEVLGRVKHNGFNVQEMEAMTWDANIGRILVVSNIGSGPLFRIDPSDISSTPPAPIPTLLVGHTQTVQMEGLAIDPEQLTLYGVDNTTDPAKLVIVDRGTGTVTQIVGPLVDANGTKYDNMEGLAFTFDPPYVLFGSNNQGQGPGQLVTISTATGLVAPLAEEIGFDNVECLVFAPDGTLYGFSNGRSNDAFITINPSTGEGSLFKTADPRGVDIEGCVFLKPVEGVAVEGMPWSTVKSLYRDE